ncbi:MAG TPA: alpha/beta fold hydrolase [Anaerolineales bacterium]|nr:alpha/beta fold hydrolase [Anaerolineales bacterium]HRF48742.1 alpha/beta fold hydrolase [Anaerolineales bacterium]
MDSLPHTFTLLALPLLLLACTAPAPWPTIPADTPPGTLIDAGRCLPDLPDDAECWMMAVPEAATDAGSRLIALPVVRLPATGPSPKEPVFWLEGGPGSSNLNYRPPAWLRRDHDVVLVGYRGVDGPVRLDCPEAAAVLKRALGVGVLDSDAQAEAAAAMQRCAERLQAEGVDLTHYTLSDVIADLELARTTLGYERVNFLAVSYGTRIAQLYAYRHPERLGRSILVSVNPPGRFVFDPAVLDERLDYLARLCAADPDCRASTPDLAETFRSVSHAMPEQWLGLPIDPGTVRVGLHFLFFSRNTIPLGVDAYLAAAEGDAAGLALLNAIMRLFFPVDQIVLGDQLSKGGSADLAVFQGLGDLFPATSPLGAPLSELLWPLNAGWPITPIAPELRELQPSAAEMLIVNGTVDFSTPPTNLEETRPYYSNAQYVLLKELGHVDDIMAGQPAAFERLATSYYATGVADASGYVDTPLSFRPMIGLSGIARLILGIAGLAIGALVALGARAGWRRWRSGRVGA